MNAAVGTVPLEPSPRVGLTRWLAVVSVAGVALISSFLMGRTGQRVVERTRTVERLVLVSKAPGVPTMRPFSDPAFKGSWG
jgi:hypothetical protein